MTIVYVTSGAWGTGTGAPNSAAQVDGNFYDLDQRVVNLVGDLDEGKRIDTVTYTSSSMTFHYTDGTTDVIPLPVAEMEYAGTWMNSTPYTTSHLITAANGFYQVLQNHTTPALPAPFDPHAVDGSGNPLYQLWMPLHDINYDAAIFVPGPIQRAADELLWQAVANRSMQLPSGDQRAYAWLDVANDAAGATAIILSIEKNGAEIGTITVAAGDQEGAFNIPAQTDFAEGDLYALRVTQSDNPDPAGLSVTLPFIRTDNG